VPALEVRDARPADHAAVGELTVAAYRAIPGHTPTRDYAARLRDVAGRAATARVVVAVEAPDGPPLGTVTYVPGPGPLAEFSGAGECGMRMLAVAPAARGRGAGRALVEACIARAREDGRVRLVIHTTDTMTAAQALYRSVGFARRQELDFAAEDGLVLRCYALELA
jgi:ribosomal protein S18 acetylase RimI-like enzyme